MHKIGCLRARAAITAAGQAPKSPRARPGGQARKVERKELGVLEQLGHLAVDDSARQPLGQRRFDTRFTQ